MPAHRALLWPLSEYFASKFESWSCNDSKPQITLLVPAGQLAVGKALVTAIYDRVPADLSQQQLLQLLVLAESYRINKISAAAANAITSIPQSKLEWETVLAMEQLPAAEPLYAPLIAKAKARRFQLLGDLEMVWALEGEEQRQLLQKHLQPSAVAAEARAKALMSSKRLKACRYSGGDPFDLPRKLNQQLPRAVKAVEEAAAAAAHSTVLPHELLLQLPFEKLIELLKDKDLKAESENTVHYTITRWLEQHPEVTSTEQLQRLADLVRLSLCSPNYITMCVCAEDSWLLPLLSTRQVVHAAVASASRGDRQSSLRWDRCFTLNEHDMRLASALHELKLTWNAPLSDIHQMLEQSLRDPTWDAVFCQPSAFSWQGFEFKLMMGMILQEQGDLPDPEDEEEEARPLIHALYVDLHVHNDAAAVANTITAWRMPEDEHLPRQPYLQQEVPLSERYSSSRTYLLSDRFWAEGEDFEPHIIVETIGRTWEEVEGHLRRRGLVFSNNCLHLTAEVSKVL